MSNPAFVHEIHKAARPLTVNTVSGRKTILHKAYLGDYSKVVWYDPQAGVNILGLHNLTNYYRVTMDTKKENAITVHLTNGSCMKFRPTGKGLYKYDLKANETLDGMWALVSTVEAQSDKYTKRSCKRAI